MHTPRRRILAIALVCCLSACTGGAGSPTIAPPAVPTATSAAIPTARATATPFPPPTLTPTASPTATPPPTATAMPTDTATPSATRTPTRAPSLCARGCVTPPPPCTIKGNISVAGTKIYHMPGQAYYEATVINPEKGERWFCTEDEARANGWRKSFQ